MNIANFENRFSSVQQHLQLIEQQTKGTAPSLLPPAIAALSIAIEELHVAVEEIYTQNQELIATRHALETERQRYLELFEEAPDGYLETDSRGTIQSANRAAATLLGVPQQYLLGKPLSIFVADSDSDLFRLQIVALGRQQKIVGWEVNLQPRDAASIPVEISVSTQTHRQQRWCWIMRDLTQRKQTEATLRQLEAQTKLGEFKTNLLNSISHEFRTPLNILSMSASTIERLFSFLNEDQKQTVFRRMHLAIQHMVQRLEEVEFFHEGDRLDYTSAAIVELEPFCQHLTAELQELFGLSHPVDLQGERCRPVYLNAKLLQQILSPLLTNSMWYSPEESLIRINIVYEASSVTLQIQDCGLGIPPEDQPHIFEPFYRGSNAHQALILSGTGLGLAIVKKSVDYSNGEISFTSEVNCGSTFTVTLPLQQLTAALN
ncbi:MAG: ATP-binding protein [Cyanophyceae cyanobacterium]